MSKLNNISVGDTVRVRYGRRAGERAKVINVSWHSNQFGSYARFHIGFDDGEADERSLDDLEKIGEPDAYLKAATQ